MPGMTAPQHQPHILYAVFADPAQGLLEGLRRAHYPPHRNHSPAHCTLFYTVPGFATGDVADVLAAETRRTAPPCVTIDRVIDLDGGTALGLSCAGLLDLRAMLAERLHGLLSGADAHATRLHVTVQNKVERAEAHRLQAELRRGWRTIETRAAAIALARIDPAGWVPAGRWAFRGNGK